MRPSCSLRHHRFHAAAYSPLFAEPGLFLIRPDQTLYAASIQTMPFARPSFSDVLVAVKFVTENDYPARGEA